jgi:hydrogenase expression/formation protein HypE
VFGECPLPKFDHDHVLLGHGSGGRLTAELIGKLFLPTFGGQTLAGLEDAAILELGSRNSERGDLHWALPRVAFTTDSFVVRPVFFPGGDIGRLAICGTVNDLAVSGALPRFVSAAFILEEGLALADLKRIADSMRTACDEAGVELVAGDTKVVDRGKGDQVFITTTGIGVVPPGRLLSIRNARPGDRVLVSGTIGDHGIAIMSVREGIEFETVLESDVAPLNGLAAVLLDACPSIRCMRDPTRGGLAGVLNELAAASGVEVHVSESALPVRAGVRAACELLGLDPLYVANEGKLVAVVPGADAERVLAAARSHPLGRDASLIGAVAGGRPGLVLMRSLIGGERVVPLLTGEQLPRIC